MNKRGDVASIIYVVIFIAIVGMLFFLISHLNNLIFTEFENTLGNSSDFSDTQALLTVNEIKASDAAVWDYAFLGIFLGSLIAIGLSAYAVKISPVFFWIYGLLSLLVLGLGVVLSNLWQSWSANPEFAATLVRFPITNAVLGSYYPLVVTAIIILAMVLIFGKTGGNQ